MMINAAVINPGGRKYSAGTTAFSVSEVVNEDTDKLLQLAAAKGGFGKRNQEALKALVCIYSSQCHNILFTRTEQSFKRDGQYCLLTHKQFMPFNKKGFKGFKPALVHIIPNSVHEKVCIEPLQSPLVSSSISFSQIL